jgi:hypothetical protein
MIMLGTEAETEKRLGQHNETSYSSSTVGGSEADLMHLPRKLLEVSGRAVIIHKAPEPAEFKAELQHAKFVGNGARGA